MSSKDDGFPKEAIDKQATPTKGDMKKKEKLVTLIMVAIMSTVMGTIANTIVRMRMTPEALAANPALIMYVTGILESVTIGLIAAFFLPFGKWGRALAAKFGAYPPGRKFIMLNCIPISIGNSTVVSLTVSFINSAIAHAKMPPETAPPLLAMWLPTWAIMIGPSIVISYTLAVLISPLVMKWVGLGGPPKEGGPDGPPEAGADQGKR